VTANLATVAVACWVEDRGHGEVTTLSVRARKIEEDIDVVAVPSEVLLRNARPRCDSLPPPPTSQATT